MILLGISGKRRSGKTLLADILAEQYGYIHLSLASALKQEVRDTYKIIKEHTDGNLKEVYDARLKTSPRKLMIRHGAKRRLEDPNYWIKQVERDILKVPHAQANKYVVSDIRFRNEAEWIKSHGGYLVRLERSIDLTGMPIQDKSETELDDYRYFIATVPPGLNNDVKDMLLNAEAIVELVERVHGKVSY